MAFRIKHDSIKEQDRREQLGEGIRKRGAWFTRNTLALPFRDVGEVATRVSGTVFWVKALPPVMTSFSRASFD